MHKLIYILGFWGFGATGGEQTQSQFQNSSTRQRSNLTLTAEAEIQERGKENHPGEEQKHQPVDAQTLNFAHDRPAFVHPKKKKQRHHHQIGSTESCIGSNHKKGVQGNRVQKSLHGHCRRLFVVESKMPKRGRCAPGAWRNR